MNLALIIGLPWPVRFNSPLDPQECAFQLRMRVENPLKMKASGPELSGRTGDDWARVGWKGERYQPFIFIRFRPHNSGSLAEGWSLPSPWLWGLFGLMAFVQLGFFAFDWVASGHAPEVSDLGKLLGLLVFFVFMNLVLLISSLGSQARLLEFVQTVLKTDDSRELVTAP